LPHGPQDLLGELANTPGKTGNFFLDLAILECDIFVTSGNQPINTD
jgi:hypothetical protein